MKSLKLGMIAIFIALAMVSAAKTGSGGGNGTGKINILTLHQASSNLALIAAIYQQVPYDEVLNSSQTVFAAKVIFEGQHYEIVGSLDSWIAFFKMENLTKNSVTVHQFKIE
jgi:hypothetical protein